MGFKVLFLDGAEIDLPGLTKVRRAEGSYAFYREGQGAPATIVPTEQVRLVNTYDDVERAKMEREARRREAEIEGRLRPAPRPADVRRPEPEDPDFRPDREPEP